MSLDKFLATLFEPQELVCFTDVANGTRAYHNPLDRDLFFSINAIASEDREPSKPWHAANVPRRADNNVASYRNFLLELDNMQLDEQVKAVRDLLPVTSIVFSGGKSHHFIISLKESLGFSTGARLEYNTLARRLHKLVPFADPTTKNPSRLSRLPFRIRPETGLEQKLIYLGERVTYAELDSLLPKLPVYAPKTAEQTRAMVTPALLKAVHEPDAIMQEYNIGGRNALFFWLGKRCDELELTPEVRLHFASMAYQNLRTKDGFDWAEACAAARVKA
jgi:hypothetical protein